MKMTHVTLAAAMAISSIGGFAAKDVAAEDFCSGKSGFYSFSVSEGEACPGERFGKRICSVDCSKTAAKRRVSKERLERKLNRAPKPKIGRIYSYSEAKKLSASWNDEKIEKLIIEMDGKLNSDERHVIRGALKKWPMVKFYSKQIGVDPRLVYLTFITESRWVQAKGHSGEKSIAQLMPGTAAELLKAYGGKDKYYDRSKKWHEGDNPLILSIYYLRDAVSATGCEDIPFDQLTAQQLLYIYHFYNKGTTNYEPTWQQSNFANSAMNLMWTYKFVENQHAISSSTLYAIVQKLTGEHDRAKEKELKPSAKEAPKPVAAKKTAKDEISASTNVIPHTYFITQEQARTATEAKAAKAAAVPRAAATVANASKTVPKKAEVKAETIIVKAVERKAEAKKEAAPKPEVMVARVSKQANPFDAEIQRVKREQAQLIARINELRRIASK
ncbi:Uncharacterised protein [uncultured archaeon]|nr:Uncharacterised protein [uncultured archaeon]